MTYNGPLPSPTEETEGFFEAAKKGIFALHRCAHCRRFYWPASACRHCDNDPFLANMRWEAASGKGEIFSLVVPRRTFHPAFPAPFVYALIKLQEGPLMPCGVDVDPDDAYIGLPVEAHFVELSPEFTVPRFHPAAGPR
jgi:uncharacterized OB-fold protein